MLSWLAEAARSTVAAGADLRPLVGPVSDPSTILTQVPPPPSPLLSFYREGEKRFGVPWEVVAAVNFIETKFGRVRSSSSAGAQGPMQFLPSTWATYGLGGDIHDSHDAIIGAANFLHASGAPADERRALFAYNRASAYVDAVLLYAGQMTKDPRAFFAYYNWQVFVRTASGDRRLTGPGVG